MVLKLVYEIRRYVYRQTFGHLIICLYIWTNRVRIFAVKQYELIMHEKIIEFLSERPALSLNQLEKEAGLPQSLISKAMKGKRRLNQGHTEKLVPVLERYGFQPD